MAEREVTQALALTQTLNKVVPVSVEDTINLTIVAVGDASLQIVDSLNLTDSASRAGSVFNRSIVDTLVLVDSAIHRTNEQCDEENFVESPALGIYGFLTLTHPFGSPTLTVNLRVPKFGNIHRVDLGTVVRRLRSGQLSICRPSTWPNIEELQVSFEHLSDQQREDLINFLVTSAGQ